MSQGEEMNPQDPVVRALKAALEIIVEEDRNLSAPPHVEKALLEAFRSEAGVTRRGSRPRWLMPAFAVPVAMAAALAVAVLLWPTQIETIAYHPPAPTAPELKFAPAAKPVLRELASDFVPVGLSHLPLEGGSIVRVRFSPETIRTYGVSADGPVDADLIVGQEGRVRAFRFISYVQ